jgi:hypothetical protein
MYINLFQKIQSKERGTIYKKYQNKRRKEKKEKRRVLLESFFLMRRKITTKFGYK